jgi:hypothetical protein
MNFLRWWSAALALMGLSIALCLSVVCIQYLFYMDLEPRLRNDWPTLIESTGLFLILGLVGAAAFWALHKHTRWLWPMQGVLAVTALIFGQLFWGLLAGR